MIASTTITTTSTRKIMLAALVQHDDYPGPSARHFKILSVTDKFGRGAAAVRLDH